VQLFPHVLQDIFGAGSFVTALTPAIRPIANPTTNKAIIHVFILVTSKINKSETAY
jgi:hypothetical protein